MLLRRLTYLYGGLVLFGISLALMVSARLGLGSWDVLHQGIADRTGLRFGWVVIGVSVAVLLLWVPLRQRPGFGTISNVLMVGLVAEGALFLLPEPEHLAVRATVLIAGIVTNGVGTAMYIGAGLGPGPRDGLMTGLTELGISIRRARTSIELSVLAIGWLLGGAVGVGTVAYAVSIGPLVHHLLPRLTVAATTEERDHGSPSAAARETSSHQDRRDVTYT